MIYLVDTNILIRFAHRHDPQHAIVRTAVRNIKQNGHQLQIISQNCVEFWNVATRPVVRNGFGLSPTDAERLLRLIERLFPVLPDTPMLYPEWRRLVVTFAVSGVQVHDARLVAAMKVHGLTHILTFNTADFTRYASEGIFAVEPTTL
ncbi:MAG TPA: type II toxin-antitoxin system VapC family toxin [Oscillatoriaceae cyanobacterium M33_DOE_052]|uniref:PIN domain-containing protein n=1 Tax=Planktothricoides sp. SpSt-374 TaxID=2282167 RepID=A0A7C3ZXP1_9CYAN|nr:type II toxin-antitoxin system VapC family toxin [Oscillatoriaceae cyanobacterium M33_DOE_052]